MSEDAQRSLQAREDHSVRSQSANHDRPVPFNGQTVLLVSSDPSNDELEIE